MRGWPRAAEPPMDSDEHEYPTDAAGVRVSACPEVAPAPDLPAKRLGLEGLHMGSGRGTGWVKRGQRGGFPANRGWFVGWLVLAFACRDIRAGAGEPPLIVRQPETTNVALGGTAVFEVSAAGAGQIVYRWFKNGAALEDSGRLKGSHADRLWIERLELADAGTYRVRVENDFGSVMSGEAQLLPSTCLSSSAGLVGWWTGDNTYGDAAGAHRGVPQGNTGFEAGLVDRAFVFNGGTDRVEVTSSEDLEFRSTAHFTVAAWVRPRGFGWVRPIVLKTGTTGGWDWGLYLRENRLAAGVWGWGEVLTTATLPGNTWTHVAMVYREGQWSLSLNGQVVDQFSGFPVRQSPGSLTLAGNAAGLAAGYDGLLDEVVVFNRALSDAELAALSGYGICRIQAGFASVSLGAAGLSQPIHNLGPGTVLAEMPMGGGVVGPKLWNVVYAETDGVLVVDAASTEVEPVVGLYAPQGGVFEGYDRLKLVAEGRGADTAVVRFHAAAMVPYGVLVGGATAPQAPGKHERGALEVRARLGQPPTITGGPGDRIIPSGGTVKLTVVATGVPEPTVQWYANGALLAGQTNRMLSLTNLGPADSGWYRCVAENFAGSAETAFRLTVVEEWLALRLGQLTPMGTFQLEVPGHATQPTVLQASTDLSEWIDVFVQPAGEGDAVFVENAPADRHVRFFRLRR